MYKLNRMIVAPLALALGMAPAFAHHSAAMFNHNVVLRLDATVNQMLWQNPHSYLEASVVGASGREQAWTIEFQSLQGLTRQGLTEDMLEPGETVTLFIHPLHNGTAGGDYVGLMLSDGTAFGETEATE